MYNYYIGHKAGKFVLFSKFVLHFVFYRAYPLIKLVKYSTIHEAANQLEYPWTWCDINIYFHDKDMKVKNISMKSYFAVDPYNFAPCVTVVT